MAAHPAGKGRPHIGAVADEGISELYQLPGKACETRSRYTVVSGDSLWSIAAGRLQTTDLARIHRYWPKIFEANGRYSSARAHLFRPGTRDDPGTSDATAISRSGTRELAPASGDTSVPESDRRSYAISMERLSGLSASSPEGATLELWVTWGPPVTKRPRVQALLQDVLLKQVAAPVTPGGPEVAILLVTDDQIPDLIFAERFGELSAVVGSP